jgi:hypothetical protein
MDLKQFKRGQILVFKYLFMGEELVEVLDVSERYVLVIVLKLIYEKHYNMPPEEMGTIKRLNHNYFHYFHKVLSKAEELLYY